MSSTQVPRRRGRYMFEEMDGESFVYRRSAKQGVYLNETGTVIWKLCDGSRGVQQIIDVLVEAYPGATEAVRADVAETIDELVSNGALKLVDPQDASAEAVADGTAVSQLKN